MKPKQKYYQQYLRIISCLVDEMYKLEETQDCKIKLNNGVLRVYHGGLFAGRITVLCHADMGDNDIMWYAEVLHRKYAPDQDLEDEQHNAYELGLTLEKRVTQALIELNKSYDIIWNVGGEREC